MLATTQEPTYTRFLSSKYTFVRRYICFGFGLTAMRNTRIKHVKPLEAHEISSGLGWPSREVNCTMLSVAMQGDARQAKIVTQRTLLVKLKPSQLDHKSRRSM